MNTAIFYVTSIILSLTGLYALWHFGVRPLLLDNFRDDLFIIRDSLYELGNSGKLAYDSPAYRSVETFLNNLIRYAHRFSFLSFLAINSDSEKAFQKSDSPWDKIMQDIDHVNDLSTRADLKNIILQVSVLLPRYIGRSSILFIGCSILYLAVRSVSPKAETVKKMAVQSFETEVYRESAFERLAA